LRLQLCQRHWLGNVVVEARGQGPFAIALHGEGSEGHNPKVFERGIGADLMSHLVAIHLGHLNIQQDEIDRRLAHLAQRFTPIARFDNGGDLVFQRLADQFAAGGVVVGGSTQAKLLRVLQNQEVTRVGSVTARKVDVRVVAATNRDVPTMIAQKAFREDLYYRLAMVELRTPSLAERKEDLPLLEKFFLERFSQQFKKDIKGLTRRAQIALSRHSWPGNVRELENALGHACMMTMTDVIDVEDLPASARHGEEIKLAASAEGGGESAPSFEDHEKELLMDALERAEGNQSEAARILRISRDRMRYKMAKYNLR